MNYKYNEILKMINSGMKPFLVYQISKEEVLAGDMSGLDKFFKTMTRLGTHARQGISITCSGYDDIPDELYEIKEVRKFVQKMFKRFPYILYYINKDTESEKWLLSSMADSVLSVGDSTVKKMTIIELYEIYGNDLPKTLAKLTFHEDTLHDILSPILTHGKKLNDLEDAKGITIIYALSFDHSMSTLRRLGLLE